LRDAAWRRLNANHHIWLGNLLQYFLSTFLPKIIDYEAGV
jgi:hypothetical protein